MYRAYLKSAQSRQDDKDETLQGEEEVDISIQKQVEEIWQQVDKQCEIRKQERKECVDVVVSPELSWVTIRVFVSSTFIDFFNEREVLVKMVFPELREWCYNRGMKFVECDLRWGIPQDTPSGDTILVCLDEIQRCSDENKKKPFFIGLIGERYGWIPKPEDVPDEAREKYEWIDNSSITFNEIMTGAVRDQNPNAAFFIRNESVCKNIPEVFQKRFTESEPLQRHHQKVLKRRLQSIFPDQVFHYKCEFKEISNSTGREQVRFSELDEFAEMVLQFFKTAIARQYPTADKHPEIEELDNNKNEQVMQRMFIVDKAQNFIGRQAELELLKSFAENGDTSGLDHTDGAKSTMRKAEDWDIVETDNKICVVEGKSGLGKTALLCQLVDYYLKTDCAIFYHMVGSTPSSTRVETLLLRLLGVLAPSLLQALSTDPVEEKTPLIDQLQQKLRNALKMFRDLPEKKLIIFIDALDQLESRGSVWHLAWLPPLLPPNIRCIVSTSDHQPTCARLYEFPALRLCVRQLPATDLHQIMTQYLGSFSKKLEPGQVEAIIRETGADSPLWVMLMAEELRVFGDFRQMSDRIRALPDTMDAFLGQVLSRLVQEDDGHEVVKRVLCLLACSRSGGMSSQHILQLCGNVTRKVALPMTYWARARRSLKPYLRVSNVADDIVSFAHEAVTRAVCELLLSSVSSRTEWHILLADFYETWCSDAAAEVYNLPFHLQRASLNKRLVNFMTKDNDVFSKMPAWERSNTLKNVRCRSIADSVIPNTAPILVCHSCVTFKRYNAACPWPTKDCCMLCSNLVPKIRSVVSARACMMHANGRGPSRYKCLLCNVVCHQTANTGGLAPVEAKLCQHCSLGNDAKRCAHFQL